MFDARESFIVDDNRNLLKLDYKNVNVIKNSYFISDDIQRCKITKYEKETNKENKEYYTITTENGNSITFENNDKILIGTVNTDNNKETLYYSLNDLLKNSISFELLKINNYEITGKDKNENIVKRFGSYEMGVFFALLFHNESKFYLDREKESFIELKFYKPEFSDFSSRFNNSKNKSWIEINTHDKDDVKLVLILNRVAGFDFVMNGSSNETTSFDHHGEKIRVVINKFIDKEKFFNDIFERVVKNISDETLKEFENKSIGMGIDEVFPIEIQDQIINNTSFEFKKGLIDGLLELNNHNKFMDDTFIENTIICENSMFKSFIYKLCYSVNYGYSIINKDYIKINTTRNAIKTSEKIDSIVKTNNITPVSIQTNTGMIVINGFSIMFV